MKRMYFFKLNVFLMNMSEKKTIFSVTKKKKVKENYLSMQSSSRALILALLLA